MPSWSGEKRARHRSMSAASRITKPLPSPAPAGVVKLNNRKGKSRHRACVFIPSSARGAVLAGGSGTLRTGEIAPHLRFVKTGPESSRIELANAGQLTVNRGLVFTMSLESLLDLRRPAVHCTRRPPRREQMACRFRLLDRKGERRFAHRGVICSSRVRRDKNSFDL